VHYQAYAWLVGKPKAMKLVKSVRYKLPDWINKSGKVSGTAALQNKFCYSVEGDVDFGLLGHPAFATVELRDGGRFLASGIPNIPGPGNPDCSGGASSGASGGSSANQMVPQVIGQSAGRP
jgi:hypothetical protein